MEKTRNEVHAGHSDMNWALPAGIAICMRVCGFAIAVFVFCVPAYRVAHAAEGILRLQKGALKLMRAGQSRILWQPGLKLDLYAGDRLHTGADTRVRVALTRNEEKIELFSHALFAVEGVSAEQRAVALLVGKGNFVVPTAPEPAAPEDTPEEQQAVEIPVEERPPGETEADTLPRKSAPTSAPVPPAGKKELGAKIGAFKLGGLKVRKKKRFRVRTVSALVGVRGTEFVVATAGDSTNVLTLSGEVTMASAELPEYEIVIPGNTVSRVKEGAVPSDPVETPREQQQQIMDAEDPDVFVELEFGPAEPVEAVRSRESGGTSAPLPIEEEEETEVIDRIEEIDTIQELIDRAEEALDLSRNRIFILKTDIRNR